MATDESRLLASGEAFADLSGWRKTVLTGKDAPGWLNSLVSAEISGLRAGQTTRSLLLSPTGRIRAEFTVAAREYGLLLLQDPRQPTSARDLLEVYMLSSDVSMEDRSDDLFLFAMPGRSDAPVDASMWSVPSVLGEGLDVVVPAASHDQVVSALRRSMSTAGHGSVDTWRALRGIPRFGAEGLDEDLPQEAGLDGAVALDKGCYLGQEAVAKVRNLGHPRRVILWVASDRPLHVGESVLEDGRDVGVVTTTAQDGEGSLALARIKWDARSAALHTVSGARLQPVAGGDIAHASRPV